MTRINPKNTQHFPSPESKGGWQFIDKKIDKSYLFDFEISLKDIEYIIEKASICINGISLTVSKVKKSSFQIWVIPHTYKLTNLSKYCLHMHWLWRGRTKFKRFGK